MIIMYRKWFSFHDRKYRVFQWISDGMAILLWLFWACLVSGYSKPLCHNSLGSLIHYLIFTVKDHLP